MGTRSTRAAATSGPAVAHRDDRPTSPSHGPGGNAHHWYNHYPHNSLKLKLFPLKVLQLVLSQLV
jgi:hypothetical protein